jgi:hypothetical protein
MSFTRFKIFIVSNLLCILLFSNLNAESIDQELRQASAGLDKRFFNYLFDKKDLQDVYQVCQDIDFSPSDETTLIHSELMTFLRDRYSRRNSSGVYDRKVYRQIKLMKKFETNLKNLDKAEKARVIAEWRSIFLDRFVDHLRYVNGLKKEWRAMIVSQTTVDSNLNREVDPNAGVKPSGTSDWQQLLVGNFTWMPFVNNKNFSRKWKFRQGTNLIYIRANKHKENEVQLMDTESVLTRTVGGSIFHSADLAWRLQNFANSPAKTSRSVSNFFLSNRVKLTGSSKVFPLNGKHLKNTSSKTSLAYVMKRHNAWNKYDQNAEEWKLEHKQTLVHTNKKCVFNIKFNFDNYKTKNTPNSNYKSYKLNLNHEGKASINKFNFRLAEGLYYRHRDKNSTVGDEKLMGLNVKASKKLRKSLDSSLDLNYNFLDRNTGDANQFQMVLGFNWSL